MLPLVLMTLGALTALIGVRLITVPQDRSGDALWESWRSASGLFGH